MERPINTKDRYGSDWVSDTDMLLGSIDQRLAQVIELLTDLVSQGRDL